VISGDFRRFAEGRGDALRVRLGIFAPFFDPELGRVDADDPALADTVFVEDTGDAAANPYRFEELCLRRVVAHGRVTDRARPDRSHERAHVEAFAGDHVRDAAELVIARGRIGVGEEKEVIDPVVFLAVHLRRSGKVEHTLERDGRFLTVAVAFSDETGPHGVVQFER